MGCRQQDVLINLSSRLRTQDSTQDLSSTIRTVRRRLQRLRPERSLEEDEDKELNVYPFKNPVPDSLSSLQTEDLCHETIDWRMLTLQRGKDKEEEDLFTRLVFLSRLRSSTRTSESVRRLTSRGHSIGSSWLLDNRWINTLDAPMSDTSDDEDYRSIQFCREENQFRSKESSETDSDLDKDPLNRIKTKKTCGRRKGMCKVSGSESASSFEAFLGTDVSGGDSEDNGGGSVAMATIVRKQQQQQRKRKVKGRSDWTRRRELLSKQVQTKSRQDL